MSEKLSQLDFLKAVYLNEELPLSVRMRAASEAAPYVHPKLGAVATMNLTGDDFAALLDRAIERSGLWREVKQLNGARASPQTGGLAMKRQPPAPPPLRRLVSDRPRPSDWESFPRYAQRPRYRVGLSAASARPVARGALRRSSDRSQNNRARSG